MPPASQDKFPELAQGRIQPELGLEKGHLPLYLALQYGWDLDTIKLIIGAYPDATYTMDVVSPSSNECCATSLAHDSCHTLQMQKNKGKAPSLKRREAEWVPNDRRSVPRIPTSFPNKMHGSSSRKG